MRKISLFFSLSVFFLLLNSAYAQQQDQSINDAFAQMEKHLKLQRKMMEQMFQMFEDDMGAMDMAPGNSPFGFNSFAKADIDAFSHQWQSENGKKVLVIRPKSEDNNLNIEVKNGRVRVHGKIIEKEEHQGQGGFAQSTSIRSFSNSIAIPSELDAEGVDISSRDGAIYLSFPYRSKKSEDQLDSDSSDAEDGSSLLRPLTPDEGDITL